MRLQHDRIWIILFFAIVGILLIPTIIAGLKGKMLRKYNAVLTLVMIAIIFSDKPKQAIMLAAFIIWQYALIKGYLLLRKQNNSTFMFCIAVILSILPLILAKIAPFVPELHFIVFAGMSYVTFRAVQMVFEVRDNLIKELSFFNFWEFVLFFPAISSGPIDRYRRFQKISKSHLVLRNIKIYYIQGLTVFSKVFCISL